MHTRLLTLIVILTGAVSVTAHATETIESVKPADATPIAWEGRHNEKIDAQRIAGPLSIRLQNCSDIIISTCDLASVELIECQRITIRNCWIHNSERCGVTTYKVQQLLVQGCRLENVATGVYAIESQGIQVVGNFARNVRGPFPRGQMAQFDTVTGAGNAIRGNYVINDRGMSHPEDDISLFKSAGEPESPILIENNYLVGDPTQGSMDKSENGSGIMLGDYGGAYLTCRRNVVISAGQVGIGVAGGHDIRVEDNLVYGEKSNVSNNGLYAWNQSKEPCEHVSILRNRVSWVSKNGEEASWWLGSGVADLQQKENQFADATLAGQLPAPPSKAPMPPQPWADRRGDGAVVRLPWKFN